MVYLLREREVICMANRFRRIGKRYDLIGERFERLVVISFNKKENGRLYYNCKCDCGKDVVIAANHLLRGATKSCGCYNIEKSKERCKYLGESASKHNLSNHRLYRIWSGMKSRCYNSNNPNYKWYGNKNIQVCSEWKNDFKAFYDWSMKNGYKEHLTIDRINGSKDYSPDNCRWVNNIQQVNNKSNNRYITYKHKTKTLSEWSRIVNIPQDTLYDRINREGWSIERAFTNPVRKKKGGRLDNENNNQQLH